MNDEYTVEVGTTTAPLKLNVVGEEIHVVLSVLMRSGATRFVVEKKDSPAHHAGIRTA